MKNQQRIRPLVEGAFLGALVLVLSFFSLYVPFSALIITFIWPVPIIVLGVRHGMKLAIMSTVVVAILSGILFHPFLLLMTLLGFGFVGVIIGGSLEEGFAPVKTLSLGAGASFFSQLLLLWLGVRVMGFHPLEEMERAFEQVLTLYANLGVSTDMIQQLDTMLAEQMNLILFLFPAFFLISALVTTTGTYYVSCQVLKKLGHQVSFLKPFHQWRFPRQLGLFFVLTFVLSLFYEHPVLNNMLVVLLFLFFIQGLSVSYALIKNYIGGKWPLLLLLVLFLFLSFIVLQLLIIIGLADMGLNLREKIGKKPKK